MTKTILITGGSGYVGTRLILRLLNETNYKIVNYDISLFGDTHLPKNSKLIYCKNDITDKISFEKAIIENQIDTVIHLACISNDPTYELNSELSKKINFDCFEDLVRSQKKIKLKNLSTHQPALFMGYLVALM